jgi:hypothetical protein
MYAFYSLLVYIFYTVFKKEEEESLGAAQGGASAVSLVTASTPKWNPIPYKGHYRALI